MQQEWLRMRFAIAGIDRSNDAHAIHDRARSRRAPAVFIPLPVTPHAKEELPLEETVQP